MAVTVINPEVLKFNTFDTDSLAETAPTSASDGFTIDYSAADQKTLLIFDNTSGSTAYTITVKAGNGIQGTTDLVSSQIAFGKKAMIVIESGKYKNMSGALKGKVNIVVDNVAVKMAAVILP